MFEVKGKYTSAKIMIDEIEPECLRQIYLFINHPVFINPVSIMPDTHAGKGCVIGFTMKLGDKVIPNVVGVDGFCAIFSLRLGFIEDKIEGHLPELDDMIRSKIPFGMNVRNTPVEKYLKSENLRKEFKKICKRIGIDLDYAECSIGTVGGGNHFIEIGKSEKTGIWVSVHSGSRQFGKKVCEYWQKIASERKVPDFRLVVEEIKREYPKNEWNKEISRARLEHKKYTKTDLDWLEKDDMINYLEDMKYVRWFADVNRLTMLGDIIQCINPRTNIGDYELIRTTHNFIDFHDNIIRKGAISSYKGQKMVIPLNMRDGILVCEGKSNPEWNFSAPHGAGRIMSRNDAKKNLDLDNFVETMAGIYSTSVNKYTLDEAPDAYKDSALIESLIEPTATIVDRIIPIHNLKDSSKPLKNSESEE